MRTSVHRRILCSMMSIPTAPFAEHNVVDEIKRFCKGRKNTRLTRDRAGNMLVRVRIGRRVIKRPVCITAHLDHPGFVADRMIGKGRLRAFWRGGVAEEYFVGSRVRFYVSGTLVNGRVGSVKTERNAGRRRVVTADIDVRGEVSPGSIGVWDLPDPTVRGRRVYAGNCDDMAGVSAMLCAIDELVRAAKSCDAYFLFTRAEEVGFIGAIAACRLKTVPKKCFIVAMETSSELPHAKMGDGPILRVGDKLSTFTHEPTAHCNRIAQQLAKRSRGFEYQRRLMDGGSCESSAYRALGYEATGMCLALGNYHNMDTKRKRIASEYVNLSDFDNVVKWFMALAQAPHPYTGRDEVLLEQLKDLEGTYRKLLRSTVSSPR